MFLADQDYSIDLLPTVIVCSCHRTRLIHVLLLCPKSSNPKIHTPFDGSLNLPLGIESAINGEATLAFSSPRADAGAFRAAALVVLGNILAIPIVHAEVWISDVHEDGIHSEHVL